MEKAVLLIEHSGEHLRCLLNPEHLELRRHAGVVSRRSLGGAMAGASLSDDPLLYVGGGRTEFTLDLLFDVSLAVRGSNSAPLDDVRELTGPLWDRRQCVFYGAPVGTCPGWWPRFPSGWNISPGKANPIVLGCGCVCCA